MKLDRNINGNGRGKYALLKLRRLSDFIDPSDPFQKVAGPIADAITTLDKAGLIEWGNEGTEGEFFVIKLRDQYAGSTLSVYGEMAAQNDREYGHEVLRLADRAGLRSPFCKKPD